MRGFFVALLMSAFVWQPIAVFAADGHPYVTAWGDDSDYTVQWPIDADHTINGAETEESWLVDVDNYAENVQWSATNPKRSSWTNVIVEIRVRYDAWLPISAAWSNGTWTSWQQASDMGTFDDSDSFGPYPTHNSYLNAYVQDSEIETYYYLTGGGAAQADAGDTIGRHKVEVRLWISGGVDEHYISEESYTITHKYEESSGP